MDPLWFRAKAYGWGWTPASVEGWVAIGLFIAGVVVDGVVLKQRLSTGSPAMAWAIFSGVLALLVGVLFPVCWMTGERPGWHWGD